MKKIIVILLICNGTLSNAQFVPNYDESRVPDFTLPDLLLSDSKTKITNTEAWEKVRRPEILQLFQSEVYGKIPDTSIRISFEVAEDDPVALDGEAHRKQIKIIFSKNEEKVVADLLIFLPAKAEKPIPMFLGYNFYGNHTIHPDQNILMTESWVLNNPSVNIFNNRANELSRGFRTGRWPVSYILSRGYGIGVMYYGDIDPDFDDNFQNGIHPLYFNPSEMKPAADEWGSIGAWAYGLSKAMDYFEQDMDIDHSRIAVLGHSRLGKTSLWAGAMDKRFALVISNESGCGGAALSRRRFGETVERINTSFPHWFCDNFLAYNNNEEALPVDQHMLIALMAPRPVYVASAEGDQWADPKGEFLSGLYANPVYDLYKLKGVQASEMPDINKPYQDGYIAYHVRSGDHDLTYYDWEQFIRFTDKFFK
jgi:hypothetical protein